MIRAADRACFDRVLERVLEELPDSVRRLLDAIPLIVEDYPCAEVLAEMDVGREELFGLYTGTPLVERSVETAGIPGDTIHLYRLGLLNDAGRRGRSIDELHLREQIRITILHEIGHYHGFDEDDLEQLGY